MKVLKLALFILAFIVNSICAQTPYFYYYKGEKQYLELNTKHIFVSVSDATQKITFDRITQQPFQVDLTQNGELETYRKRFWTELSIEDSLSQEAYLVKLLEIKNSRRDIIVAPYFKNRIGLSNFFYVQLKSLKDTILLKQEAEKENVVVVYQNYFMPLWFVVSVTENSRFNAMEAANYFYESGLFQSAEPDLMADAVMHVPNNPYSIDPKSNKTNDNCADDIYFENQWGLKNTRQYGGTSGVDIKICEAWEISTGSGIIVAVIDEGIELNHPDLESNMHPLSLDSEKSDFPNNVVPQDTIYGSHGTACAGIIGAIRNNEKGIAGVAPDCKLMSISNSLKPVPLSQKGRANGINWAWRNGADVISNSWQFSVELDYAAMLEEAIDSAVTRGRSGKGCIVVFISGNQDGSTLNYPGSLPNVITVGAISPCGERKYGVPEDGPGGETSIGTDSTSCDGERWGSNYGAMLNVMAPGVLISTTDRQGGKGYNPTPSVFNDYSDKDYTQWFNGTSAACPHVAGVAALVLSVNPDLTQAQVRQIIESTCIKLPGYGNTAYNYGYNPAHPNGTWNNEMGHGLVNAHAAVLKAQHKAQCRDILLPVVLGIIDQNTTWNTSMQAVGNILIPSNVTLTITSEIKCDYDVSFTIHPGGELIIDGGTLTNACEDEQWQGITVIGDITKPLTPQYQGYVQVINGGTIENAKVGIHSTNGGLISTKEAHFINNTVAVKIDPVATLQQGMSASFTQTQFVINDNYFGSTLDFENHLKLSDSKRVTISGCTFSNEASPTNHIYGKNTGIWAFNSPLMLEGYCPPGSPMGPNGECLYLKPSTFSGFNVAITASNSGKTPLLSIQSNEFSDNLSGIELHTVDYANIVKNEFDLSLLNARGLFAQQSTGYSITENNFVSTNNTLQTKGIMIEKSGSDENVVYKNYFENLYVGVQATDKNSSQSFGQPLPPLVTGLQFQCNDFYGISRADILVGYLPGLQPWTDNSVRKDQGTYRYPAGNKFIGRFSGQSQRIHFANHSLYDINYHYSTARDEEPITMAGSFFKYQSNYLSHCPSLIGPSHRDGYLDGALAQYDEWNAEYENWLAKLLAFEGDNEEEYHFLLDMVSYYSALKDNYFNSIIVAEMSNYENLRFLFAYRAHYSDYLSIAETHLAENNYHEALATLAKMYAQFEVSEEQILELKGFEAYIHWLQQLDENGESIYTLSDHEINHLVNYVETHTGRGTVFTKNILCVLYGICIEDDIKTNSSSSADSTTAVEPPPNDNVINLRQSMSSACEKSALENITIYPNPTTGELQVTSYELQVTNVEIFDVYGRKLSSHHLITLSSHRKIDISHLNSGIYFVKISTVAGEVIKKIIKQ